jgi:hypothetical protein
LLVVIFALTFTGCGKKSVVSPGSNIILIPIIPMLRVYYGTGPTLPGVTPLVSG